MRAIARHTERIKRRAEERRRRVTGKCVRAVKVTLAAPSSPLLDRSYRFVEPGRYRYLKTRSRPTVAVFLVLHCTERLGEVTKNKKKKKKKKKNKEQ